MEHLHGTWNMRNRIVCSPLITNSKRYFILQSKRREPLQRFQPSKHIILQQKAETASNCFHSLLQSLIMFIWQTKGETVSNCVSFIARFIICCFINVVSFFCLIHYCCFVNGCVRLHDLKMNCF